VNVISEYLNKPWEKGNKQENTGLRNRRVTGKTEALPADYFFENACRDRVAMIKQDRRNEIREARNRRIRRDLLSLQAALTSEGTPAALVPGQRKQVHEQVKRTELTKNGTLRRYRWTRSSEANSDRGWIGYMQYVHGLIGCVLAVLALIHIPYPTPLTWLPYAGGAILAFITLKSDISIGVSRILAIGTAAVMFFLFAMFFLLVPKLQADW
jgi:hypothetical protein